MKCHSDLKVVFMFNDNELKPGCVIRHDRVIYDHYGIYVGNKEVIHLSNGKIRLTSIKDFAPSNLPRVATFGIPLPLIASIDVMTFHNDYIKNISLEESCQRAYSYLGKSGYDLIKDNCEHFAIWCRTGQAISTQAFGKESEHYAQMAGSIFNIPRFISNIYSKNIGMQKGRTVFINYITDII